VVSAISYTLGANLEQLVLTGAAISGNGNGLANVISGNAAANILRGNGGNDVLDGRAGNDAMIGGAGDDTYVVNSGGDSVTEAPGGGTDLVRSSVSFDLRSVAEVENLTLIGTGNIAGTGTNLGNVIRGNRGNNTLNGLLGNDLIDGGPGIDTMAGGDGDDVFIVDNAGDLIVEDFGSGIDLVRSFVSFDLSAFAEVENLTLLGSADINATGNGTTNDLTGNSGNNVLNGGGSPDILSGGPGNDILIGGVGVDNVQGDAGADIYRYNTVDEGGDVITFVQADGDRIRFQFDADATTPTIKEPFTFIGTAPFSAPGQIRFEFIGNITVVFVNIDNDTDFETNNLISGQITLTENDFVL
jgi:Ca2+-binding RTX toxin-like protein